METHKQQIVYGVNNSVNNYVNNLLNPNLPDFFISDLTHFGPVKRQDSRPFWIRFQLQVLGVALFPAQKILGHTEVGRMVNQIALLRGWLINYDFG